MSSFDAIIIPGGGVRARGELPSWVRVRLDRARERYNGEFVLTLSAATCHRPPPLDESGFPIFESRAMAEYLLKAGIPRERLLIEMCSYDTIGNAFFARVLHADVLQWRRMLVINSDFHIDRTRAIFDWVFGLEPSCQGELEYESVSDPRMPDSVVQARLHKERQGVEGIRRLQSEIRTMREFHDWFFLQHEAYRAMGGAFRAGAMTEATLGSY